MEPTTFKYLTTDLQQQEAATILEVYTEERDYLVREYWALTSNSQLTLVPWENAVWSVQEVQLDQHEAYPTKYSSTCHHKWPHSCCLDPEQERV